MPGDLPPPIEPPTPEDLGEHKPSWMDRVKTALLGKKRELKDPGVFHKVSLIAFLAWVGLGADGLSSSAYGPEATFRALREHGDNTYLAPLLALATAMTVFIISYAYSRIIEHFPFGGGGYVVATRLLGSGAGVVSGSALLVDYVLTISTSIAASADAVFSFLPPSWNGRVVLGLMPAKLAIEFGAILLLIVMNLRGVKESVTILTPLFLTFIVTHAILIGGVILGRAHELPVVVHEIGDGFHQGLNPASGAYLGLVGMVALCMKAYSMGGGTYTGIEAVSNGITIMREPKVETGKRTMALMAVSLAFTAGGLVLAYLLLHVEPPPSGNITMNALLADKYAAGFRVHGVAVGQGFVYVTLLSEALLLFVAAQAGFIDGPRVMANMAHDSWLPHRFTQLSDRLTTQNGVLLMGGATLLSLYYTKGVVDTLLVMYSINVFMTFSLTEISMCRFWIRDRKKHEQWKKHISVHVVGLCLCMTILCITVYEKFSEGGWVTLATTVLLIALCFLIRRHYRIVQRKLRRLDDVLGALPAAPPKEVGPLEPLAPTAVLLVGGYGGLGVHSFLTIQRLFPGHYKNFIFISIGVIDSATFRDVEAVEEVRERTEASLRQYVELARRLGFPADSRMDMGTEVLEHADALCRAIQKEYPRSVVFAGKLIFEEERWYQGILHNETAYQLQRRLQFDGLNAMVLPVRVLG